MKNGKGQMKEYKGLLLVLLSFILALVAYFFGYNVYIDKTAKVADEVLVLDAQLVELNAMVDQKEYYEQKTKENNDEADKILACYDSNITEESIIMDDVEIEKNAKTLITAIGFTPNESVYTFGAISTTNPGVATGAAPAVIVNQGMEGVRSSYSMIIEGEYDETKDTLKAILEHSKRKVPVSISMIFDASTGIVTTTMNMNEFVITGEEREAEEVKIPKSETKVDNIFYDNFTPGAAKTDEAQN